MKIKLEHWLIGTLLVSTLVTVLVPARSPARPSLADMQASIVHVAVQSRDELGEIEETGSGSGIVLSSDGRVLICAHETVDADSWMLTLRDGRKFTARLVWKEPELDVAVLRIVGPASGLTPARFGASPKLGEPVFIVSHPGPRRWLLSSGIVGQVEAQGFITDAVVQFGSSGGGVFDARGRLIGMVAALIGPPPLLFFEGYGRMIDVAVLRYAEGKSR